MSFNGHLLEATRPKDWPDVVKDQFVYRCDDPKQLTDYLNERAREIKLQGGLTIQIGKDWKIDREKSDDMFDRGALVPMHMFTHIDYTIRAMAGEVSNLNDEGVIPN